MELSESKEIKVGQTVEYSGVAGEIVSVKDDKVQVDGEYRDFNHVIENWTIIQNKSDFDDKIYWDNEANRWIFRDTN